MKKLYNINASFNTDRQAAKNKRECAMLPRIPASIAFALSR